MRYGLYVLLLLLACLPPQLGVASDAADAVVASAIYEVPVADGVSYEDVVLSLKVLAEGENFVNPAIFPLGEHLKARGQDPGRLQHLPNFPLLAGAPRSGKELDDARHRSRARR